MKLDLRLFGSKYVANQVCTTTAFHLGQEHKETENQTCGHHNTWQAIKVHSHF